MKLTVFIILGLVLVFSYKNGYSKPLVTLNSSNSILYQQSNVSGTITFFGKVSRATVNYSNIKNINAIQKAYQKDISFRYITILNKKLSSNKFKLITYTYY